MKNEGILPLTVLTDAEDNLRWLYAGYNDVSEENDGLWSEDVRESTVSELLQEILNINEYNPQIIELVNSGILENTIQQIHQASRNTSKLLNREDNICYGVKIEEWNKLQIKYWAQIVKGSELLKDDSELFIEAIAVISQANIVLHSNKPRDIQLIAVWIFINCSNPGMLMQIFTGEGKSTICAILAALKVLEGFKVDVITSSEVLAQRDAYERKEFFEVLNISCSFDESGKYIHGEKECYKNDIVYSNISNFQFDLLRHEHQQQQTRGGRGFEVVIIDEADSVMIDELQSIAMLSGNVQGFEDIACVLSMIASEILRIGKQVYRDKQQVNRYIDGGFKIQGNKLILEAGSISYDIDDIKEFLCNSLEKIIVEVIGKNEFALAQFLKEFILREKRGIVKAALASLVMKLDQDYIIIPQDSGINKIVPVDYKNTGVVQEGQKWLDCLHFFLEIKHSIALDIGNKFYFKYWLY